jgi:hypothetical protein
VTLTGTGSLWLDAAQVQAAVRYNVTVTQHGFMYRASGRIVIEPHDAATLIGRLGPNSDLVLVLDDGRRWPCTLKDSNGVLLGRGEIR